MTPVLRTALAATLAVLLVACGGGDRDLAQLRADLDTQARAQQALRDRIAALEAQLGTAADGAALRDLGDRLADLDARLTDLAGRLDTEATAREEGDTALAGQLEELRGLLDSVQTTLETLRAQLLDLGDELELLRSRFDQHVADHG